MRILSILIFLLCFVLPFGCGAKKLSERDQALQKQQQGVDLKRGELNQIAGQYLGELVSTDGTSHRVRLLLEVKDLPQGGGEGADPIIVPRLVGSFRFILGREDLGENVDAPIQSSEYLKAKRQLSIVVRHPQFGDLVLSTTVNGKEIAGTWTAASLSRTGEIRVVRDEPGSQ